jgi:hypothetical protein
MLMKTVSVGCGTTMIAFGTGLIFAPEQELKCIRTPTGFLTTLCHSLLIMPDLSPAAASIVKAFDDRYEVLGPFDDNWQELCIANALRALVVRINGADAIRQDILSIAAELEGCQ